MDTTGIVLAVLLAIAVIGQLCLPLIGRWNHRRSSARLAKARARLLEAAADRQLQHFDDRLAKLGSKGGGDE
jgi:membrane protein DedA with SNARE-associated domain